MCVCPISEPVSQSNPQPRGAPQRRGDAAEDQTWRRRLLLGAQDLPALSTLSQKAFSDLPTKFEARHQYFPASFSVTLDSVNLQWASVCLLTTLCRGNIERHSEAFYSEFLQEHICKPAEHTHMQTSCKQATHTEYSHQSHMCFPQYQTIPLSIIQMLDFTCNLLLLHVAGQQEDVDLHRKLYTLQAALSYFYAFITLHSKRGDNVH